MREVASLLNDMVEARIIDSYALFGAVAQMRYTQAVATMDADVLIVTLEADRIDMLGAVYRYCQSRGYMPEGEAIRVGEWPVQFIPVFNAVTEEAVRHAEIGEIDGVPVRVVAADYLAVIALATGRPKDHARILALLDADATLATAVGQLAGRHGLQSEWQRFTSRFLDD